MSFMQERCVTILVKPSPAFPHENWDFGIRRKLVFFSLTLWNFRPKLWCGPLLTPQVLNTANYFIELLTSHKKALDADVYSSFLSYKIVEDVQGVIKREVTPIFVWPAWSAVPVPVTAVCCWLVLSKISCTVITEWPTYCHKVAVHAATLLGRLSGYSRVTTQLPCRNNTVTSVQDVTQNSGV